LTFESFPSCLKDAIYGSRIHRRQHRHNVIQPLLERAAGRAPPAPPPHPTTTLVRAGDRLILVDPSLPPAALVSQLNERSGLRPDAITDIFCTTLRPTHRWSIEAFPNARWLCQEDELSDYRHHLQHLAADVKAKDRDMELAIATDLRLLKRFVPCPDKITPEVHLYPLAGPSAHSAGLLLAGLSRTTMIVGDVAMTREHVEAGRVWTGCADTKAAMESLAEILEIADLIVCGHDNYILAPSMYAGAT
jgi:glyoxylase-like metal-dependent hydrolase (beta-lactamase superfamily II)